MQWRNCFVSTPARQVLNWCRRAGLAVGLCVLSAVVSVGADNPGTSPVLFEDLPIMDERWVTLDALALYVLQKNPSVDLIYLRSLHRYYKDECSAEGVSQLVALAQMVHETDYLLFSGAVSPVQYNFAGLGSTSAGVPGLRFPSMRIGVRAHVQHLKAYGSEDQLEREIVDPRFGYVARGSAVMVRDLVGRWAMDGAYAQKILAHASILAARE